MAATSLTPARALRAPRRFDMRALFGVALMLSTLGGSILFWSATADTRDVLVATRELPVGARLDATDLAVARVRVSDRIYAAAVPASERETLLGRELTAPVHAAQILVRAQFSGRTSLGPGQMALAIPITAESAAGGRIRPGDAVQVLLTTNKSRAEARTTVILPRATVYDVGYEDRLTVVNTAGAATASGTAGERLTASGTVPGGAIKSVTLVVTPDEAVAVAQARHSGELDLALLPVEPAKPAK